MGQENLTISEGHPEFKSVLKPGLHFHHPGLPDDDKLERKTEMLSEPQRKDFIKIKKPILLLLLLI